MRFLAVLSNFRFMKKFTMICFHDLKIYKWDSETLYKIVFTLTLEFKFLFIYKFVFVMLFLLCVENFERTLMSWWKRCCFWRENSSKTINKLLFSDMNHENWDVRSSECCKWNKDSLKRVDCATQKTQMFVSSGFHSQM